MIRKAVRKRTETYLPPFLLRSGAATKSHIKSPKAVDNLSGIPLFVEKDE